jgi:murein endopeptidase
MKKALQLLLILNVGWLAAGCDPHQTGSSRTDFSDSGLAAEEEFEPFFIGQRDYEQLRDVEPPAVVRERLPDPPKNQEKPALRITKPKLQINVDLQEMEFKFTAESARGIEDVHLKGTFDRSSAPWIAELYAVDQKVRDERRVGATVLCLTANYCDIIGVDVYYRVNGKTEIKQLQSGVAGPRIAMSGDGGGSGDAEGETDEPETDEPEETRSADPSEAGPPPITIDPETGAKSEAAMPPKRQAPSPRVMPDPTPAPEPPGRPAPKVESAPRAQPPAPAKPRPTAQKTPSPPLIPIEEIPANELKDRAIEYPERMNIPLPSVNPYRVEGLPEASKEPAALIPQAMGYHTKGRLEKASFIPFEGDGFIRAAKLSSRAITPEGDRGGWGTQRSLDYFQEVVAAVQKKYPGQVVTLGNVSRKSGGYMAPHASHQTGLDLDVYFLSASNKPGSFVGCSSGKLSPEFDLAKNWDYFKILVGIRQNQVIAIFLHDCLKQALCRFAKQKGEPVDSPGSLAHETLRTLVPETRVDRQTKRTVYANTHHDHAHVRLKCPDTRGCGNWPVSLPKTTGCR